MRFKNMRNRNASVARHFDVNIDIRSRIEYCGDCLVIIAHDVRKFRDPFSLDGLENERH